MPESKLNWIEKIAYRLLRFSDVDLLTLRRSVRKFASSIPPNSRVLDAGAGLKPYEKYFAHCRYESCDFPQSEQFFSNLDDGNRFDIASRQTYVCSLEEIPVENGIFDYVLCTQVLEHVPHPNRVVTEFNRILKDTGRLFLTVPQGYGIHGEPFNYFYFTKYGLELVLTESGFVKEEISERGGYFLYLYDRMANAMPRVAFGYKRYRFPMIFLLSPLHILLAYFIGPLLLLLEPLDREKRFTLGYVCVARKQPTSSSRPEAE